MSTDVACVVAAFSELVQQMRSQSISDTDLIREFTHLVESKVDFPDHLNRTVALILPSLVLAELYPTFAPILIEDYNGIMMNAQQGSSPESEPLSRKTDAINYYLTTLFAGIESFENLESVRQQAERMKVLVRVGLNWPTSPFCDTDAFLTTSEDNS